MVFTRARADVREPVGADGQPDDLRGVDLEQLLGRLDAADDRHVRSLVPEIAEVDGERGLRRSRDADEHDVRLVEPPPHAVVVLDRELDRLDPLEVRGVERCASPRLHPRGDAGDARDRVDRVSEKVAVVHARAATELAHRVTELRSDERVHHHRRAPARLLDGDVEILDVLDPGVANLFERLIRELRLEREHQTLSRLARRVRDDVELDRDAIAVVDAHGKRLPPCPSYDRDARNEKEGRWHSQS